MNASNFKIRRAESSDLAELAELRAALWPESGFADHARELDRILSGNSLSTLPLVIFVAEAGDGVLAGFLEAGLRSHADGCDPACPVGYVEGWYVAEAYRYKGAGSALLHDAEDWARAQGCKEMASDAQLANTLSQQVHESVGFAAVERSVLYRKSL